MFIKKKLWEKLIKTGLKDKDGLLIARTDDDALIMHARGWTLNVDMRTVPKDYKAVIVAYIGDIPTEEDAWKVFAHEDPQQVFMDTAMDYWIMGRANGFKYPYEATRFVVYKDGFIRLVRCQKTVDGRRNVLGVSEEVIAGIDWKQIRSEYETPPMEMMGASPQGATMIAWYNNCGILIIDVADITAADEPMASIRRVMDKMEDASLVLTPSELKGMQDEERESDE